jgi:hypothetical protein
MDRQKQAWGVSQKRDEGSDPGFSRLKQERAPSTALNSALDMVSALSEAGLTVVPVKPTMEMLASGSCAGDVSVETAWRVYQAMIAVAD